MLQKSKRIICGVLLLVFTAYYVNISFFTHAHIINGVTIVHSHFHDKAHTQTGTHSESELTLISALSVFQSFQATLFFIGLVAFFSLLAIIRTTSDKKIIPASFAFHSLRAPPFLF